MRFSDLFQLSTRMFKARTSRTFLTILGMSVGIGAILFLVSLGYGLQNTLLQKITTSDSLLTLDVSPDRSSQVVLDAPVIDWLKNVENVVEVSPATDLKAEARQSDLIADVSAIIVEPSFLRLGGAKSEDGSLINSQKTEGVVVSSSVAKIFGGETGEVVGKKISLTLFVPVIPENSNGLDPGEDKIEETKKVVLENSFEIMGVIAQDDNIIYVNKAAVQEMETGNFSQVKVRVRSDREMGSIKGMVEEKGFFVSSLSETVDQANKVFTVVKIVLMLFGIIALVVSAIGMFNTMTITLLERTEEIGIMKSIGASDMTISLIFIFESTIMGFLGGLTGIIIGWLEGQMFNGAVNLIATHFGGEKVDLFYSPIWFVMTVIIFSAFVGFITGVIPARRASRIDPLDALRYK